MTKQKIKPQTLKGFRDFLPKEAKKRQYIIDALKKVFELYGFEPLETPAFEYEKVLLGKYGGEGDKLMYRFMDKGRRKVAMRYDQTVPLARVIAQYQNQIPFPFKRYQIQPVWRAENPQKGRYREFLQCDIDTVGIDNPRADAEVIALVIRSLEKLNFKEFKVFLNDRSNFEGLSKDVIIAIDKINKIGEDRVRQELIEKIIVKTDKEAIQLLRSIVNKKRTKKIDEIERILKTLGIPESKYEYIPMLARGLDYYTSTIFEIEIKGYSGGSVGGGGRYDNLIGMFADKQIPAVGFSFGFDRLYEAMEEQNLFPPFLSNPTTKVLITVFSGYEKQSMKLTSTIRNSGINCEIYLEEKELPKQLKYADKKGIPYVVIIGRDEAEKKVVKLKNMKTGEQKELTTSQLVNSLTR